MVLVRSGNHKRLLVVGMIGDGADVNQFGILAALERQIAQDGVLAGLHDLGEAIEDLAAVEGAAVRPIAKGLARGDHALAHILTTAAADVRQGLAVGALRAVDDEGVDLALSEGGRQVLRRFMVRGHWRRANATWSDQRLRWIEPYWKGPDMGMIIERDYRLRP